VTDSTIRAVRTIRSAERANYLWLEIETADGHVGLGETNSSVGAVEAHIHDLIAPYLLGEDASSVERHWWAIYGNFPFPGIGVESRALSAVDIALWDLAGKRTGLPLQALLGGAVRDSIPVYNTCSGPDYYKDAEVAGESRLGDQRPDRPYEDYWAFHNTPVDLARDLLSMGVPAMKIWPFDLAADETGGFTISRRQLDQGLAPIRAIREALGDDMTILLEMHGRWQASAAMKIAEATAPYDLFWLEDPVAFDDFAGIGAFARSTATPTAAGENLATFYTYKDLVAQPLAIVISEPMCVGGITAIRRVAHLAQIEKRGFAAHDCGGPVNLAVDAHLAVHAQNTVIQETTRANYLVWYPDLAEGYPVIKNGRIWPTPAPGHGVRLLSSFRERTDVTIREARIP
jgi:L-alanine-DL-glutamate epimerase-like enolase superfamily enzyme